MVINRTLKLTQKNINLAVEILKRGGVIVYPTETAYGLGADATNESAAKRIFEIKKREAKFLPFIVADKKMAKKYCILTEEESELIDKYMPGPLTIISKKKNNEIPDFVNPDFVFRISESKVARELSKQLGKPLISTSVNLSGQPSMRDPKDIEKAFGDKVDLILDEGVLPESAPSTIVKDGRIVRQGAVKIV